MTMSTPQPDSQIAAAFAPARTLEPTDAEVEAVLRRVQARTTAATTPPRRRLRLGGVGPLIGSLAAVAIVVVAVALVRHAAPPAHDGGSRGVAGARQLVTDMSVLRRAQTAADRTMPTLGGPEAKALAPLIIPRYTRLVASPPGARAFLVVTKPSTLPGLWSSRFGDDVGVVVVAGGQAGYRRGFPAVDLHDPANVFAVSAGYLMGVFPDGVASVRWTFRDPVGGVERAVTKRVVGNVAVARIPPGTRELWSAVWYGAGGRVVPTSERLLEQMAAARQAHRRAAALRLARRSRNRIAPALLADFPVFAARPRPLGPAPSGAEAGLAVAHPSLSSLPLGILEPGLPGGADLRQVRLVTTAAGLQFWIIPGAGDACLFQLRRPQNISPLAPGTLAGGAGECAAGLDQIEQSGGMWDTSGPFTYGFVAATNRSVTLIMRGGATEVAPVIGGVFVARAAGFVKVQLTSASGKLVTTP
jgi:hypothetical protein